MSIIHAPRESTLDVRTLLGPLILTLILIAYGLRLWYLQVVSAEGLVEQAERSGSVVVERLAPRGSIVDGKGVVLAGVQPAAVVTVRPRTALSNPIAQELVAAAIGMPVERLRRKIEDIASKGDLDVPLVVGVTPKTASWIAERGFALPGFGVETLPVRTYREPVSLAHVMGYAALPSERDVDRLAAKGLKPAQYVGKDGLERQFERELMGTPGVERMTVDARRRPVRSDGQGHPVPGRTLVVSMDVALQREALSRLSGHRGAVVVLRASTGEVLCLASSPTYDASQFLGGISSEDYASLRDDPRKPLFPRAIGATYAPGSTFKVVTTIASAMKGSYAFSSSASCRGYYQVGTKRFKCLGVHGAVSFDRAMTKSCNAYFADLAVRTGPDGIRRACKAIGLGGQTHLDLPGEAKGLVPTVEWWAKHRDRRWALGDTANFGVGQGELACTPLQMACVAAMVANEGKVYRPHIVRATVGSEDGARPVPVKPELLGEVDLSPEFWGQLKRALRSVVTSGTARSANISAVELCGKTGSAENSQARETHSWFIGFAPSPIGDLAIAVVVENAGHGGEVAAPIAGQVLRDYLARLKSTPSKKVS